MSQYLTIVNCHYDKESLTEEAWVVEVFDSEGDTLISDGYASTYEDALMEAFKGLDKEDR
jgi:hypothetical protein